MRSQDAVSSVVGTVLLLAITVSTFGGVAFVVMQEVESQGTPPHVDLVVESAPGRFVVKHLGGDSLPSSAVTVYVYDGVTRHAFLGTSFPVGPTWDIGESLVVGDVFPGVPTGVEVISRIGGRSDLLVAGGSGHAAGSATPPDLSVASVHATPMIEGNSITFRARIANTGGSAPGNTVLFEVLDGATVAFSSSHSTSLLQPGGSRTITSAPWTPTAGTFTLRVTVDAQGTVEETDETDNVWLSGTFTPAAAGSVGVGFVDVDSDGAFTPGLDPQIMAGPLTAGECSTRGCAAGDLGYIATGAGHGLHFLPGALTTGAGMHFEAPGDVVLPADLSASAAIRIRSLQSGVTFSGDAVTSGNQGSVRLEAAGVLTISGALVKTGHAQAAIQLAGQSIGAGGATVSSNAITFTAPASGSIDQSGLAIQDRTGSPGVATNTNLSCVTGTLAQGSWTVEPSQC